MIFTILGTDHYQVSQKLKELKAGFIQKRDKAGLNVVNLDGENLELNQLQQEALTTPFLSEKKMIVIKNAITNKDLYNETADFIKDNHNRIDNIVCFVDYVDPEKRKVDKKNKLVLPGRLFKYLSKAEYFWEFNLLKNKGLENWIKKYTVSRDIKIESAAISELAIRIGGDLFQITSELDKLFAYNNGVVITADNIKTIVSSNFDDNIFGLVDALGNKNKKVALKLVTNQLNFGNHPLMLISMINRQFKLILKTKNDDASAIKLKMHPFVFSKVKIQSQNFTTKQLIKIMNDLLEIEKQTKNGEKNPELLLNLFITKNC